MGSFDELHGLRNGGLKEGALNVAVTDQVLAGASGRSGNTPVSFVAANTSDKQELAHEMAHQFMGDTKGWRGWIRGHDPIVTGQFLNMILDIGNKSERMWMNNIESRSGLFSHYPLASAFNNNASNFQKSIQPTTKPQ